MSAVADTRSQSMLDGDARAQPGGARVLEIEGLRHAYGSQRVLDGLSLDVRRGEIFALLGPNGCGKSTTLKVLTGLLEPDAGTLRFEGQPVEPGGRALRNGIGVVFQSPSLDIRLSARENLTLSARLYGLSGPPAAERIASLLDFTELSARADEAVKNFSGGMRRRLELARALLHDPALIIMDEPTTGLDEASFRRTWQRIERLRIERGLTVLFTTHRAEEAQLCDRVAVVDGGRIIAEDTPERLRRQVSGDILTLEASEPEALAAELGERFELKVRVLDGKVVIERERGHELIPRIVEALPAGRIVSLSMHRPTLADVFVKLTGRSLGDDVEGDDPGDEGTGGGATHADGGDDTPHTKDAATAAEDSNG